jgi:hypothetical protein
VSKAGERLLKSARRARAFVRGEETEGFVVHVPEEVDVRVQKRQASRSISSAQVSK